MADVDVRELAKYRMQSARERFAAAQVLLENGLFRDAISRAYYAVFQAARAALATKSLDARKHSGVVSLFIQHFVKPGILPKEYGKILKSTKDLRHASDYDDFYLVTKEEAREAVEKAGRFLDGIAEFLEKANWGQVSDN
ncbi:HEPN domain-containing protein [Desulfovirgula thermocuniculi]|uniref:HEPN domain-containing protein n=1 Tax=Desulfovirgula thermocuniculi TaxID=348842 RepID=UPI00041F8646|nr:HEPN domain-containing protein [Desulfovirgula thermocuniculi]